MTDMEKSTHSRFKTKICSLAGTVLVLCFFVRSGLAVNISSSLKKSTSYSIAVRTFSQKQLNKYRNSPDFQYISSKPEALNWWGRVKLWILQKIFDLIHYGTGTNPGKIILILLVIALIIYVVYRMTGADKTGLWERKNDGLAFPDLTEKDIHVIDFDRLINEAAGMKNYRLAVRLWYLKTLKNLSGKDCIKWRPGKTNYEYVAELAQTRYGASFKKLTHDFEYSWYGETTVTAGEYEVLKQQFMDFNQPLS
jgi:hypothetical protein